MCGLTGVILKKEERSLKQLKMITDKFSMMGHTRYATLGSPH